MSPGTVVESLSYGGHSIRRPTLLQPSKGWAALKLAEVWEYRELLYFLTWRDILVRYKQTVLGAAWAILQPLLAMVIFTVFFGRLAKIPSGGVPYSLFSYAGLVLWMFFANGLSQGSNSLITNPELVKKVYFPRMVLPTATVLSGLVDFLLAFLLLIGMMVWHQQFPTVNLIWAPVFVFLALGTCLGVTYWMSAMNVMFRDVRYTIPFLTQIWMFGSPIVYPSSIVPEPLRVLYGLNPMVGVVEGFRWAMLGTPRPPLGVLAVSTLVAFLLLVGGMYYFRRVEKVFADLV
ncbi:MAG: ABC transporter permease [Firmicutes bacterium]|nr:ABC transporter permease [Bacillota bacterium]